VQDEKQRACFSKILASLKDADNALITVPSIMLARWDGKVNEVRAMREVDLPRAEQIGGWLKSLGFDAQVVNLEGRWSGARKVRPNTYELWFGNAPLPALCSGPQAALPGAG
jgi:hypothetical protein